MLGKILSLASLWSCAHPCSNWTEEMGIGFIYTMVSSVQSLSPVWLCDPMDCSMPGLPVHQQLWSLLKLMSIQLVMPSSCLILCPPLLLLPSIFPSKRVFPNESVLCIRWPKYWIFSFSISPSNEYSGLISFKIDWFDLLGTPKGSQESSPAPQFKSINSLVLSLLYGPHLTSLHMTTIKTITLTIWTFVGKVISLLCNMLSSFVIAFLQRSKCLLIS